MKLIKKLLGFWCALAMMLCGSAPVLADDSTTPTGSGSITINQAENGATYNIYKILNLESYNAKDNSYLYTVADDWKEFVTNGAGKDYLILDGGYVTWKDPKTDAAAFAKAAYAYAKEQSISATDTKTAEKGTVSFTDLPLGYYLVGSSTGALANLDTTNPTMTMDAKNAVPTSNKVIVTGDTTASSNTASTGSTVNYKTTITVQAGAENYVLHDTMSSGLTFDQDSLEVNVVRGTGSSTTTPATVNDEYALTPGADGHSFTVSFTQEFLDTLNPGDQIVITYDALLNSDAAVTQPGQDKGTPNTNTSYVTYGSGAGKTTESSTNTYTYALPVYKYTTVGGEQKGLAGATFTLSTNQDGSNPITFTENVVDPKVTEPNFITTGDTGKFTLNGLAPGTYYLTETAAPDGYAKLTAPVKIVIAADGTTYAETITVNENTTKEEKPIEEVSVENTTHSELPGTGGIGTTIFYVIGSILLVGAIILFVTRKRMNNAEK